MAGVPGKKQVAAAGPVLRPIRGMNFPGLRDGGWKNPMVLSKFPSYVRGECVRFSVFSGQIGDEVVMWVRGFGRFYDRAIVFFGIYAS